MRQRAAHAGAEDVSQVCVIDDAISCDEISSGYVFCRYGEKKKDHVRCRASPGWPGLQKISFCITCKLLFPNVKISMDFIGSF